MKAIGTLATASLCCAFGFAVPVAAQTTPARSHGMHTHQHGFSDAAEWSKMFDDPKRDEWQKPHQLIQALALKPDAVVAIADFRRDSPQGPPVGARLAPDRVRAEMARAGYTFAQEHAFLPYQHFLVFSPAGS